ncbi:NAD(+) synthase [Candidatus Latescibacterota bacterium]
MKKKVLLICLIATLFFLIKPDLSWQEELTVVYTANSSGKLRSCNCPNDPYGGLSERVTLIKSLRQLEKPFLLVDSGNMVSLFGAYDTKAADVMQLMNLMKYDAAGVGCHEMFHGVNSALKMTRVAEFPLISATIAQTNDGAHVFNPYVITRIGKINTGIISVCDSTSQIRLGSPKVNDYFFLPKTDVLEHTLLEISPKCDFIIVLSQLSPDENKKILEHFPKIDLIIEGYGNEKYDPPIVIPQGIIVSPGSRGQFVGMITLEKSKTGKCIAKARVFGEELLTVDMEFDGPAPEGTFSSSRIPVHDMAKRKIKIAISKDLSTEEEILEALILGTKDYIRKNGFSKAVIGLSGGIDSSLVAAIAVSALGAENVIGVTMPSKYTSSGTRTDAEILAKNLGIQFIEIPISQVFDEFNNSLANIFKDCEPDITEENIQARIRGTLLMALSNKLGWLVLTTGNKSEMATGYATLYGDMAGGFAIIKDVPKLMVYSISSLINKQAGREIIPESIIVRPPSAELRPDQKDSDSLPPYDILDPVLKAYIEDDLGIEDIVSLGFDRETVKRVVRLCDSSEYKRRQAPPGVKITPRAFGRDRRLPITNRYRNQ